MAEKTNTNKMLTIGLIIVVALAAIVMIYVNLPQEDTENTEPEDNTNDDTTNDGEQNNQSETVLTLIYGEEQINYTIEEIKSIDSYTGIGGKVSRKPSTTGPYNYTGVEMKTLLSEFENLPENYSIKTTSTDGYPGDYSYNQINGTVELYNETRVSQGNATLTMIVAYMEEDTDITDSDDGPLIIAFVDDYYTDSSLWAKMLASIEIIEE